VNRKVTLELADLETVYGYALNFDVDDDPAMIRVKSILAANRAGGEAENSGGARPNLARNGHGFSTF
jgi:hypothetical protein